MEWEIGVSLKKKKPNSTMLHFQVDRPWYVLSLRSLLSVLSCYEVNDCLIMAKGGWLMQNPNEVQSTLENSTVGRILFFLFLALFSGLAVSIPFMYPSMTLWYKVGLNRILLQAGQVFGLLAMLLVCLQLLASVRPPFLVKLFGLSTLMRFHRMNSVVIFLLALGHVLLVLGPEGFANLPIGMKYWSEMVGALLFSVISFLFFFSWFRDQLGVSYPRWRAIHKPLGYGALLLLFLHVRFVSDSFTHLVPQAGLYLLFLVVTCVLVGAKYGSFWLRR